ncbi:MAG: TetR/AcrR family transcriptional regulator [Actinomycetota bacterium]|nr:TetR/AcrR family transcriptional regulator [Actinomycetota bacterium]
MVTSVGQDSTVDDDGDSAAVLPPPTRRLSASARGRQLRDVALRLFAERGFGATTMDDIAEAAGVTKPLLYQHFASKRALYLELMETVAAQLIDDIRTATTTADGPRQQVERGFLAYFSLMTSQQGAFRLLYGRDGEAGDPELGVSLRRVEDTIAEAIDPLIDAGLDDEHRRTLAYAVVGMAEGVGRHWIASRGDHGTAGADEALLLATRVSNFAWAGLRQVHRV